MIAPMLSLLLPTWADYVKFTSVTRHVALGVRAALALTFFKRRVLS
jgi:hypothetical protein